MELWFPIQGRLLSPAWGWCTCAALVLRTRRKHPSSAMLGLRGGEGCYTWPRSIYSSLQPGAKGIVWSSWAIFSNQLSAAAPDSHPNNPPQRKETVVWERREVGEGMLLQHPTPSPACSFSVRCWNLLYIFPSSPSNLGFKDSLPSRHSVKNSDNLAPQQGNALPSASCHF